MRVPAIDLEKVVKTGGALLGAGKVSLENVFKYTQINVILSFEKGNLLVCPSRPMP